MVETLYHFVGGKGFFIFVVKIFLTESFKNRNIFIPLTYLFKTTAQKMNLSSVDIGNPAYDKKREKALTGADTIEVEVWFDAGERSEFYSVDFDFIETADGIEVTASKPNIESLGVDDLKEDVKLAIEAFLHRSIRIVHWLE